ncbi:MAG: substrate-binding domain-containing protein, partial [Alkalispirochaeta sp.]
MKRRTDDATVQDPVRISLSAPFPGAFEAPTPADALPSSGGNRADRSGNVPDASRSSSHRRALPGDELHDLLRAIQATGSISAAARTIGRSYRHTWDLLDRASRAVGAPLVNTATGGLTGGGTRLAEKGHALLAKLESASAELALLVTRPEVPEEAPPALMIAGTMETLETGLSDLIARRFYADSRIRLGFVGVGSGEGLTLATQGRIDATITHAPELEREFLLHGWGEPGVPLMQGHFVIVGPAEDPAGISRERPASKRTPIAASMARIAGSEALFFSRADRSGTHMKELELWRSVGIEPREPWYRRCTGCGNREILRHAATIGGYALIDAATLHAIGIPQGLRILRRSFSEEATTRYTLIPVRATVLRDTPTAVDRRTGWTRQLA